MGGKPNRLTYLALVLAALSLVLSGFSFIFFLLRDKDWQSELYGRVVDLEEEHDYLLELQEGESELAKKPEARTGRPAFCQLLPDPGPCTSQVQRWYFLPREGDCIEFPWGGCQGNDNNFLSLEQCRSACQVNEDKPRSPHLSAPRPATKQVPQRPFLLPAPDQSIDPTECLQSPVSGPCKNRISRFYYEDGHCKSFDYGGCGGNSNNFFTRGECLRKCAGAENRESADGGSARMGQRSTNSINVCILPEEKGSCSSALDRYRYDSRLRSCVRFVWSGCGGNSNNFISKEKCENRCSSV